MRNNPLKSRPVSAMRRIKGHEWQVPVTATDARPVKDPEGAKDKRESGPGSNVGDNGLGTTATPCSGEKHARGPRLKGITLTFG